MPNEPRPAEDLERMIALFQPLLGAESLDALLEQALQLIRPFMAAYAVAIFVTDGGSIVREAWLPKDESRRNRLRPHLLGLTHQSVQSGEPTTLPFPPGAPTGLTPHLVLLRARGRTLGTVCCTIIQGDPEHQQCSEALLQRFADLVADRIAALREQSDWRASRAQHERWFRQLDQHIRVLDRERQKFAALVSQDDVYVFVTDAHRTIQWVNRAVDMRFPAEGGAGNWIGRSCSELCARIAGAEWNGVCPVAQATETNQPAHAEFREETPDGERSLYATALPIKGPDGLPQEVVVMLQDLSDLETVRKSEARYRALFDQRQRAEERLGRLETRLRAVVASSPIVLFSVDRDGIITLSEGRGLAALGLEPGQQVGQSVFDLYQATPAVAENIRRALRGEEFSALVQVGAVAFDAHYAPLRDDAGEITGVLGVATDVTRSRRAAASPPLDAAA